MNKYLIDYENMHWCGGQLNVVVNASSPDEAMLIAGDHMDEEQRALFSDEYEDEPENDEGPYHIVNSVEILDENHEDWKFYKDPSQASFYPEIN